jgi:hypothetical protein
MKVSVAISKQDEQDLPSGHKRKKQGDIIAVKPAGWLWGTKEYENYLIIELDLGNAITTIEDAQKLTVPHFETGELWYPSDDLPQPRVVGKRRYQIPIVSLIAKAQSLGMNIDNSKLIRKGVNYQPFEKITIPFADIIYDKNTNKKLVESDLMIIREVGK